MQYLLDFVHEHTLEEQLYLVLATAEGELELMWQRRDDPSSWQLRPLRTATSWERVARTQLLSTLTARQADMGRLERELRSIAMTQIAFADMLLRNATERLGRDTVQEAVLGHRDFIHQLQLSVSELVLRPVSSKPRMQVLSGGGAQSESRSGHLRVVP